MSSVMKVVGIIGAGAAGLCASKHVLATPGFTPIVWEKSDQIGGTWVYSSDTGKDKYGLPIHSSMYSSLRTNLPKEVMGFPDFPFPEGGVSFIHRSAVLHYLDTYTKHFNLLPSIKLEHHVEIVEPQFKDGQLSSWCVKVRNLSDQQVSTTICDALIVCNGHYSVPRSPDILNKDSFKGFVIHSHNYREPLPFTDHNVVILGAAASGLDISMEIAKVAKKVLLSHNHPIPIPSKLPDNIEQVPGIVEAKEDGFILKDNSFVKADSILYCTGYEYTFPFLTEDCGVTVKDNQVQPLYKHVIHATYPSMAFIGLPYMCLPFTMIDMQVRLFKAVLTGEHQLPTSDMMKQLTKDEINDFISYGSESKHYHRLVNRQWNYFNDIIAVSNTSALPCHIKNLYNITTQRIVIMSTMFKEYQYFIGKKGVIIESNSKTGEIVNTKYELFRLKLKALLFIIFFNFPQVAKLLMHFGYFYCRNLFK